MLKQAFNKCKTVYLLPSLLTLGILCVVYIVSGLFPFGPNILAWSDMAQQSLPFMMQMKDIASGTTSVLYNMANASGMNFWGVFLYFVCSPFTALGLLVPREGFFYFANILLVLKLVLASCTAAGHFAGKHTIFPLNPKQAGALGVMYAFCGFALLYYQNLVWLDQLILFPLLISALQMLYKEGRMLPFALALAASIACQFQIAFTILITVILCSAMYVVAFVPKKQAGIVALRLGVASVVAGVASGVVWLPTLFQFLASARGGPAVESIKQTKLLAPLETTLCMLLCTSAIGAACLYLCFKKRFATPGVLYAFACLSIFSFPLVLDPVNMLWHAGSYQAFPSRYGFIPLYFGLLLLAAALHCANQVPAKRKSHNNGLAVFFLAAGVLATVLFYIWYFYREQAGVYVRSLWGDKTSLKWALLCFALGALVYGLLLFLRTHKWLGQKMFVVALCVVLALECTYNSLLYIGLPAYNGQGYTMVLDLHNKLPEEYAGRVKYSRKYADANIIGAMGYSSVGHYSSFTRTEYIQAQKKLGYSGYWMEMSGLGGTLLSDHFMGIGAVICQRDEIDPMYDEENVVYENTWFGIVEQPHVPGALNGFVVEASPQQIAFMPGNNRVEAQNWLYKTVYGGSGAISRAYHPTVLQGVGCTYDDGGRFYATHFTGEEQYGYFLYEIEVREQETLYFDCFRDITNNLYEPVYDSFGVSVNGIYLEGSYPNSGCNGILNLGTFENETVTVQIEMYQNQYMYSFGVFGMAYADVVQATQNAQTTPIVEKNGRFYTAAQAQKGGEMLVLPIGYDEGLTAKINGNPAEVYKVLDGFVGVPLQAGQNSVEIGYTPKGFVAGVACTLGGVLLLVCLLFVEKRYKNRLTAQFANNAGKRSVVFAVAQIALYVLAILTFLALYVVPIIIWLQGERALHF